MSTISGQSMNYLEASSPYSNSGSIRSYDSICSLAYTTSLSSSGQVYTNAAFEHLDSSGVSSSSSHDYEDLQSIRTEAKSISGPRKKTNDLYEPGPRKKTNDVYQPTRPQRVRQITECSDISIASSASSDAFPIKKETCLSKLILCLILAVSVVALVLVVLIISGKLGPKCGCAQENNLPARPSTGRTVSIQSLVSRIVDLENNMLAMKEKMDNRELAVKIFFTKHKNQVELLQAQVSAQKRIINETTSKVKLLQAQVSVQKRIINETANKVSVVDGVWVNMTSTHKKFEKKLDTGFKLLNTSVKKLNNSDAELTSTMNELRQNQILTERMSKRLAVNVTQLESSVQELKNSSSNMSSRAGSLERGYTQMNTLMKTLQAVNGGQNVSHEHLQSLYKRLNGSLVTVNTTLNDKLKRLVASGGKKAADFSTCQHKKIPGTPGSTRSSTGSSGAYSDASYIQSSQNKRAMGITCSTDYARHYKLLSPRAGTYTCACKGVSPTVSIVPSSIQCFLHVWECSL